MTRTVKLALVLVAALTLSACGTGPGGNQAETPAASQEKTPSQAASTAATKDVTTKADATKERIDASTGQANSGSGGEQAPNFVLTTLDGKQFNLKGERGKVVALFFTAGWCDSCIPEAQAWSELYPSYEGRGLDLLMVSIDPNDTPQTIEGFKRRSGIRPLPWAIDKTGEVSRSLNVGALGSTVIVDREGRIAYRDASETDSETLKRELGKVL